MADTDGSAAGDNICVYARVRPIVHKGGLGGGGTREVVSVPSKGALVIGGQTFTFDGAAPSAATQVRPLVGIWREVCSAN
jgi:hypothetical protein